MINLNPHYIFIIKVFNRISFCANWVYIISPVRWLAIKRIRSQAKVFKKTGFVQRLQTIIGDFQGFPDILRDTNDSKVVIEWADKTINHEFDYLGSGFVKLNPIDWHLDFKSGFRWPKGTFYLKYKLVDVYNDADVKVPWEMSRCHHLLWLGEAYLFTKDEKYAKEVINQIKWWIDENPCMYSINWTCAMDVSIRAVNWMYAINMISQSASLNETFFKRINDSLFEHGWFIFNNLEKWYPYSANHYASNITGLLYLGQLFKGTNEGKKWWNYALKEYFLEVRFQVLPSGAHFERSISYHRLMTELFAYPYFMLQRVNEPIPLDIQLRVESMFDFTDHYTKPNGLAPQLGDNDDGRLLPFVRGDFRAHNYLLSIGYLGFGKQFESLSHDQIDIDTFFLLPEKKVIEEMMPLNTSTSVIKDHRDAGFVILKTAKFYLIFSNTSLSSYPDLHRNILGSHTHADGLSFEFSVGKYDFIIDPGTYVYTASSIDRNKFRSTGMHNTVSIDGKDQVVLLESSLFSVNGFYEVEKMVIKENQKEICVSGSRKWKLSSEINALHFRKIKLLGETEIEILDEIHCGREHIFIWHFYLAPEINPEIIAADKVILQGPNNSMLKVWFSSSINFLIELVDCEVSPSYGVLTSSKAIRIRMNATSNFSFLTSLHLI
ncbi:MAG: alginate lyase family protein [Bacteroidia bacterium]|nr:alginate lyase family protein [Bacteroidia bacterium]